MPNLNDPAIMAAYGENMKKEKALRIKWFYKNIDRIRECATTSIGEQLTEAQTQLEKLKEEALSISNYRFLKKRIHPKPEVKKNEIFYPMKPVESEVRDLLYGSVVKDGTFRYLHRRMKKSPEDKFYFTDCTSWTYGWELKKSVQVPTEKQHPRSEIIKQTIFRKSGLGADPIHYKDAI